MCQAGREEWDGRTGGEKKGGRRREDEREKRKERGKGKGVGGKRADLPFQTLRSAKSSVGPQLSEATLSFHLPVLL